MTKIKKPTAKEIFNVPDNYLAIEFGYTSYIFPYIEGVKLLEVFKCAEYLDKNDYDNHLITPMPRDKSPEFRMMSFSEYSDKKMSHILKTKVMYGEPVNEE